MKAIVIIPSRYASSRFPAKPLADIHGKPMIEWVHTNSSKSKLTSNVYIATDDKRISSVAQGFGAQVIMTSTDHPSGTDRIWEAYSKIDMEADVIINVQGDEPYIEYEQIDRLIEAFQDPDVHIATLIKKYKSGQELFDENKIRVVIDKNNKALYFSRSVIPFVKNTDTKQWQDKTPIYQHIGMYAYRPNVLKELCSLEPSSLEIAELLEQLRWLENGYAIHTVLTETEAFSIDTPEDLERLLKIKI